MAHFPWLRSAAVLLCSALLAACSALDGPAVAARQLPPLVHGGTPVTLADVATLPASPDLLALTPEMEAFVARYAPRRGGARQRMLSLHEAIKGEGVLGVVYDPFA